MAQIDNIPQNERTLDSLSKINQNFNNLNTDKLEADSTSTLENKTINADNNTVTELTTASIKTTSKTGQGTKLVTGTNGADGSITKWDVNGNAVSSSVTEAEIETLKSDATLNTDTDVSGNDWVLDEDDFASDSATKVPTQQSVKSYVDTKVSSNSSVGDLYKPYQGSSRVAYNVSSDDIDLTIGAENEFDDIRFSYGDKYRSFTLSDFGGFSGIRGISVYNGDIYVLVYENIAVDEIHLFRINDYKTDLEASTITEIDGTTNGVFVPSAQSQNVRYTIGPDGKHYFTFGAGSAAESTIRNSVLVGDTLTAPTDVSLSFSYTFDGSFGVISSNEYILLSTNGDYARYDSSGTLQREISSMRSALLDNIFILHQDSESYLFVSGTTNNTEPLIRQTIV